MTVKLLIIGGVAGGASAAARARRVSESAEIILLERGPEVSFANCGLPYYIGGEITDRSKLLVTTPARLRERFNLDVRTRSSALRIDRQAKTVRVKELDSGREYEESYDKLILSPGAAPLRPPIPGLDLPGIYTLRNLQDTDVIKKRLDAGISSAIVIGAGFIGLEMVENLVKRGVQTTLIDLQPQVLPPMDKEMTAPIMDTLRCHRVEVLLGDSATSFQAEDNQIVVTLKSGRSLIAEMVVLGVGVRPESQLALDAGLDVGPRGGIRVNEYLQTSDPNIYAVGDAIETRDFVLGSATQMYLAGPANRQGRIAAENAFGGESLFRGCQGTAIVGCLGKTAAMTGASEKALRQANRPFLKAIVHPAHHAGYYPGAEGMTLKILFRPDTGTILGAQGVGGAGVDKRIDVIAVAIQAGMTIFDLEEMELAYAPQYGSAKDPVNMAGFVGSNRMRGTHPQTDVESLMAMPTDARPYLLDVRTTEEFQKGTIPSAVNIPVDELRNRLDELPKDRPIAAFCQVGQRGYIATRILMQKGFDVVNVSGGYKSYTMAFASP